MSNIIDNSKYYYNNEPRFTIEEIRNYINSRDSFGDVAYFLSAENIIKANQPTVDEDDEENIFGDNDPDL